MFKSTISAFRQLAPLFMALLMAAPLSGCAERQKKATAKELRDTSEGYIRRLRWGDFKGMARYMVPEQRSDFVKGILEHEEDGALKVLDCEMEHVEYRPSGEAIILTRMSWYRLPSVTSKSEIVTIHFEDRDGEWFVSEVEKGPLPLKRIPRPDEKPSEEDSRTSERESDFQHLGK